MQQGSISIWVSVASADFTTVCLTECLTMTKTYDFSVFDIREHNYAFAEMSVADIADKKKALEEHRKRKAVQTPPPTGDAPKLPGLFSNRRLNLRSMNLTEGCIVRIWNSGRSSGARDPLCAECFSCGLYCSSFAWLAWPGFVIYNAGLLRSHKFSFMQVGCWCWSFLASCFHASPESLCFVSNQYCSPASLIGILSAMIFIKLFMQQHFINIRVPFPAIVFSGNRYHPDEWLRAAVRDSGHTAVNCVVVGRGCYRIIFQSQKQ